MASNINYISIDETFPLAGRDNDSQGFRDNFYYIKNSLKDAKSELEDLQSNVVRVDQANDLGGDYTTEGQNIIGANFLKCSEEYYDGGNVNTNVYINYENGTYQSYHLTVSNMMLSLDKFPVEGKAGKMVVHITSDGIQRLFYFASQNGTIKKSPAALALFNKTNIECTATTASSGYITCSSNSNLQINQPIKFTGNRLGTLGSGLYYVKAKNGNNQFSVSNSINSQGVAGNAVAVTDDSGSMYIESAFIAESASNVMVFEFWTTNNGVNMFMDYLGTFV